VVGLQNIIEQRMREAEAEMMRSLNDNLYGDDVRPRKKRTVSDWMLIWKWRAKDAWEVLRGRADIC